MHPLLFFGVLCQDINEGHSQGRLLPYSSGFRQSFQMSFRFGHYFRYLEKKQLWHARTICLSAAKRLEWREKKMAHEQRKMWLATSCWDALLCIFPTAMRLWNFLMCFFFVCFLFWVRCSLLLSLKFHVYFWTVFFFVSYLSVIIMYSNCISYYIFFSVTLVSSFQIRVFNRRYPYPLSV